MMSDPDHPPIREHHLTLPLTAEDTAAVHAGDVVHLSGEIVMSIGLQTFRRLREEMLLGTPPPVDLRGAALLHLSSAGRETADGGHELLYVNPTTSTRFDEVMPDLIRGHGLRVVGGKGGLGAESIEAMRENGTIYVSFLGGGATLLSQAIREVVEVHWTEYIWQYRLIKARFEGLGPLTVGIDAAGNSLYRDLKGQAQSRLADIRSDLAARREHDTQ